jgi:VanZ family protein
MLQKFVTIVAWAAIALVAYVTVSPIEQRPTLPAPAGFEHVAAFAIIGALFCLAYPRQTVLVCFIVIGSAILLELAQLLTPDRHGRLRDAVEKMAGGIAGIVVARCLLYFDQIGRWFQN